MSKKLHSRKGFSLVELLVAIAVLVLLIAGITTSMGAATRSYTDSTFQSDSATLKDLVKTSLSDLLRYAPLNSLSCDSGDNVKSLTTGYFGGGDLTGSLTLDGSGHIIFKDSSSNEAWLLLNAGAYSDLKIQNLQITFNSNKSTYHVEYDIVGSDSIHVKFDVRSANASSDYYAQFNEGSGNDYELYYIMVDLSALDKGITYMGPGFASETALRDELAALMENDCAKLTALLGDTDAFEGWYADSGCTVALTVGAPLSENVLIIYPKMNALKGSVARFTIQFPASLNREDIVLEYPVTVSFNPYSMLGEAYMNSIHPANCYLVNSEKLFWYKTEACTGSPVANTTETVPEEEDAEFTYFAQWKEKTTDGTVTVKYHSCFPTDSTASQSVELSKGSLTVAGADKFSWEVTLTFDINTKAPSAPDDVYIVGFKSQYGFVDTSKAKKPADAKASRKLLGWASSANGSIAYFTGATLNFSGFSSNSVDDSIFSSTITENHTLDLYAVWGDFSQPTLTDPGTISTGLKRVRDDKIQGTPATYYCANWTDNTSTYYGSYKVDTSKGIPAPKSEIKLYAVWNTNAFKVTLNYEDNTTVSFRTDSKAVLPTESENGKTLVWYTNSGRTTEPTYNADGSVTITKDTNFYGKWKANTVSYYTKSSLTGSYAVISGKKEVAYSSSYSVDSLGGRKFVGWALSDTQVAGESLIAPGAAFTPQSDKTNLYARWENYTVHFDVNCLGASSVSDMVDLNYSITLPVTTRKGWTFEGWYADAECKTLVGKADAAYTPKKNGETLYAKWSPTKYLVEYSIDGGKTYTSKAYTTNDSAATEFDLPAAEAGYTYTWQFETNSVPAAAATEKKLTIPAGAYNNIKLKAIRKGNSYTITYYKTADSSATIGSNTTANYGEAKALQDCTKFSVTGMHLKQAGWYDEAGNYVGTDAKDFKPATTPKADGSSVYKLHLEWEANTVKIEFYLAEDASSAAKTETVTYQEGETPTLPGYTPPNETGYDFKGWKLADGSTFDDAALAAKLQTTSGETVKLYANKEKHKYQLNFYWNLDPSATGEAAKKSVDIYIGDKYTDKIGTYEPDTQTSVIFDGWYLDRSCTTKITSEMTFPGTGNQGVYAKWAKQYTVTINLKSGKGGPTGGKIKQGGSFDLTPAPTRAGYTFSGWTVTGAESTTLKASATTYIVNGDVTLTAKWTGNKYSVVFDKNADDATGTVAKQDGFKYGTEKTLNGNPEDGFKRKGYTFAGWLTSSTGTTTVTSLKKPTPIPTNGGTYTVYAKWEKITYTLSYVDPSGEAGGMPTGSPTIQIGDSLSSAVSTTPTRTNYQFDGWYWDSACTKAASSTGTYDPDNGTTLYAKWTGKTVYFAGKSATAGWNNKDAYSTAFPVQSTFFNTIANLGTDANGYKFLGWSATQKWPNFATTVTKANDFFGASESKVTVFSWWLKVDKSTGSDGDNVTGSATVDASTENEAYVTLPTVSRNGYKFLGWKYTSFDGSNTTVTEKITDSKIKLTGCRSLFEAQWEPINYKVSTAVNDKNMGKLSADDSSALNAVPYGSTVTVTEKDNMPAVKITWAADSSTPNKSVYLTATPNPGCTVSWKIGDADLNGSAKITTNCTIKANFALQTFNVTISAGSNGSVSPSSIDNVPYGSTISDNENTLTITYPDKTTKTVTATPDSDYKFSSWTYSNKTITSSGNIASASFEKGTCFTSDTQITLADGTQKPVDEIKLGDMILSYSFYTGEVVANPVASIETSAIETYRRINVKLAGGKEIGLVGAHSMFDADARVYFDISEQNYQEQIGKRVAIIEDGKLMVDTIESIEVYEEEGRYYSIITAYDYNAVTNGILTVNPIITNITFFEIDEEYAFDQELMAEDIEKYGLSDYSEWALYMSREAYEMTNVRYLNVLLAKNPTVTKEFFMSWLLDSFGGNIDNIFG